MARRRRVASCEPMGWITTNPLSLLGHLLQGRFGCVAMDEAHTLNALRYLAFNPMRWLSRVSTFPGLRRRAFVRHMVISLAINRRRLVTPGNGPVRTAYARSV